MQFHSFLELSLDDTHALGQFLCDDPEQEACLFVTPAQRAPAVRLHEALIKDDFHDSLSEIRRARERLKRRTSHRTCKVAVAL
ncbi:conserved hypothetical protein [Sinorhizobium medicae]|uniref:Uncharacterized protein n=1 Tax=Sinorhizobium medicae TaxID=110321 RepID=A0A508WW27_9HYPH|nr:conserved hypothetical protein [Sinorhizobium medicae]